MNKVSYLKQIARQRSRSPCKLFLTSSLITMQNLDVVSHTVCTQVGSPKFFLGHWGPAFSGWERGWPVRNALLYQLYYRAKFDHSRSNRRAQLTEIRHKKNLTPRLLPFKVTHWNRHGSIGNLWLPSNMIDSNHEPISYRFRDKWRFRPKIANFSEIPIRMYLTLPLRSHLWTFVTAVALKKTSHYFTR